MNPIPTNATWQQLAFSKPVLLRSLTCALIVGSILFSINHLDCCIVNGKVGPVCLAKGLATATIPFMVSMVSSVLAARGIGDDGTSQGD